MLELNNAIRRIKKIFVLGIKNNTKIEKSKIEKIKVKSIEI
jgi:hypothetical protein